MDVQGRGFRRRADAGGHECDDRRERERRLQFRNDRVYTGRYRKDLHLHDHRDRERGERDERQCEDRDGAGGI